ncbi:ATP synthase subunit I [Kangiella sp. TOML190]|uniref:ATP synthase subunit I n=1 Tax=Kangiella sp. TOML190 TaxID=2931351 RepID=UPI00203BC1BD|nr:ATP synthase subunit I [Kangiella sp. TOML190]
MSQTIAKKQRQAAYKMVKLQLAISIILGLLGLLLSKQIALSLLVGALIVVVANFVFTSMVFRKSGAQAASEVKKHFAIGESLKLLLTIGLLIAVFTLLPVQPAALLIGFSIIVLSQWFAPWVVKPSV